MKRLEKILENFIKVSKKSRLWRTFVYCLAVIIVFTTTYSLILPAITVEKSGTENVECRRTCHGGGRSRKHGS